jgi:O-antigen ligase
MIGYSIIFGLGNQAASQYLIERILKGGGAGKDLSGGRLQMWADCLRIWTENPVMGTGLGSRLYGVDENGIPFALPIHNLWIQSLMETGLIGFTILILTVGCWLRRSIKTLTWETSSERLWPRLVIITWVATILFTTLYGEALAVMPLTFIFWMMLAFECAAHSQMIQWYQKPESQLDEVS